LNFIFINILKGIVINTDLHGQYPYAVPKEGAGAGADEGAEAGAEEGAGAASGGYQDAKAAAGGK